MNKKTFKFFLVVFLFIIIVPVFQTATNLFEEPKLGGHISKTNKPSFQINEFVNSNYQDKLEVYLKRSFGFRGVFLKIFNQYQYWLFKKTNAWGIIVGKEQHLFAKQYIDAKYGKDFIGKDSINSQIRKLQRIQKGIEKQGKGMLVVIAASKGTFHEEFIPEHKRESDTLTNYRYYKKQLEGFKINHIDFNSYFLEIKGTKDFPLYAKHGIHWTVYSSSFVLDSLIRKVENDLNVDLPELELLSLNPDKAKRGDDDILAAMNLLTRPKDVKYSYPKFRYKTEGKDSVKVLIISDSFYFALGYYDIIKTPFPNSQFWFYYKDVFPKVNGNVINVDSINVCNEFSKFDYYILMANEAKLKSFAWGALDDLDNYFSAN